MAMVTCMSRANSYSSSVSTLTINALSGYSTASCDKNPEAKVSHAFTNTKINNTNVTITSYKEMKKKKKKIPRIQNKQCYKSVCQLPSNQNLGYKNF